METKQSLDLMVIFKWDREENLFGSIKKIHGAKEEFKKNKEKVQEEERT